MFGEHAVENCEVFILGSHRTWNGMIHDAVSGERSQEMKITVDENSRVHVDIQKY